MSEPHFDRCQFDYATGKGHSNSRAIDDAVVLFDSDLFGNALGVSEEDLEKLVVETRRQRPHYGTAWARDTKRVLRLLRRVFPHVWKADRPLRVRHGFHNAARWFEVIRLYFALGWSQGDIGEKLNSTPKAINDIVYRIRCARTGMSAHGERKRRGIRP